MRPPARLRRTYFDCRFGQLHVYQAIPPGGGFDEATALLCIAGAAGEGRFFQPLLGPLGADRSIYAPDLPGHGLSDPPAGPLGAEQQALALLDLLDSLRQRRVDVLAHASGIEVATALAGARPGALVRRVACSAPPPGAVAGLRKLVAHCREIPIAGASDAVLADPSVRAHMNDLIGFFGAAAPA
ncbi:MAG TPA: alpha/beta fold hydrolase [Steroidobacteraceae bacterium]|nr:alpha/beta fold hydrolase [Steroidobacteraceae bacterium]